MDGSGSISIDELKEVFYSGCNEETVDQAMVDAIIQSVDKDGDNEIDFEEFRCMMLLTATASQPSKTTLNGSTGFQEKEQAAKKTTYKSSPSSLSSFTTSTGDISDSSFSSTSDEDGLHHRNTSATHRNSKKDELEALASMMKGKTKARRSMFERCTTENN